MPTFPQVLGLHILAAGAAPCGFIYMSEWWGGRAPRSGKGEACGTTCRVKQRCALSRGGHGARAPEAEGPGLHGQNPETELTPPGHRQGLGGRTPPTPPPALASQLLLSSPGMPPIPASWPAAEGTSLQGATLVPARCAPARSVPGAESQNLEEGLESVPLGEGAEAPRQGPTCPNPCLAVQLWGALGGATGMG